MKAAVAMRAGRDSGGLERARLFQPGTPVYVKLLMAGELRAALGLGR